jgi:hypothetical protein
LSLLLFACLICSVYAANRNCENCTDCSAKIRSASPGDVILLTKDASNSGSVCIVFSGRSGVSFDCQGRSIEDNSMLSGTIGINIDSGRANQVKNCRIMDFDYAVVSNYSNESILEHSNISNSGAWAIVFLGSDHGFVRSNIISGGLDAVSVNASRNNTFSSNTIKELSPAASGVDVHSSVQNSFVGNDISSGGIHMDSWSEDNSFYSNRVCLTVTSTAIVFQNGLNYGDNNYCDGTYRYNDACVTGCRYSCSVQASTTTTTSSSTTTTLPQCVLPGDYPPCGAVSLDEVVDRINEWASGLADLSSVVNLINGWTQLA